ncbi:MAG: DUF1569 domain-containing protein [Acidobacteriaceae bacterium]
MPTLRNEADRKGLVERLGRVRPEAKAQWGSFDAPGMMSHLSAALDEGLGVLAVPPSGPWMMRHFPVKHLAVYVVPMPKGAKAPRELLARMPGDFEADRRGVVERMERVAARPKGKGSTHFLLGLLTNEQWAALSWKHIDHHLRQFGA